VADYAKVNNVAAADIAKVNNVAKAAIANMHGITTPSSGATLWTLASENGGIGTAAAADLNAWTCYESADMGTANYTTVAYGKDGAGDPVWVAVNENGNREIRYSSDPTAGVDAWTDSTDPGYHMNGVAWGDDVWVTVGDSGRMYRSTDGGGKDANGDPATWTEVDLSGLSGKNSTKIDEIITDGDGNWMFGQDTRVYYSTNGGAAWSLAIDLNASGPQIDSGFNLHTLTYTGGKWIVYLRKSGYSRVFHATDPTGTWTGATVGGVAQDDAALGDNDALIFHTARRMAAGDGTVIIVAGPHFSRSTNSGVDWTQTASGLPHGDARDIATDGQGNWVVVHDDGRVSVSTDNGANFAEQTGVQDGGSNTRMRFPTGSGGNLRDLESVAANVLLPV